MDYLTYLTDENDNLVNHYVNLFGVIQLGSVLVTPFVGLLFNRYTPQAVLDREVSNEEKQKLKRKQCILPLSITLFLSMALCFLTLFNNIALQIPQYILYTVVRGFLYSCHAAYISLMFPAEQFGTLVGIGCFCAGIVSFLNYALFQLTTTISAGNPLYSNIILLCLVLISASHPINIWTKLKGRMIVDGT